MDRFFDSGLVAGEALATEIGTQLIQIDPLIQPQAEKEVLFQRYPLRNRSNDACGPIHVRIE